MPNHSLQLELVHTYRHTTSPAGREKMAKEKEKLILDRKIEEALRKGFSITTLWILYPK